MKNWVAFVCRSKMLTMIYYWDNCMILKFPSMSAKVSQYTGQDSHSNPGTRIILVEVTPKWCGQAVNSIPIPSGYEFVVVNVKETQDTMMKMLSKLMECYEKLECI